MTKPNIYAPNAEEDRTRRTATPGELREFLYRKHMRALVPTFADPNDEAALSVLRECFPDRSVIGIDCRELIWGLGAFHCLTQQQPAV